ncbi:MAG: hypothetical protein KO202_07640 [Methanobacteriaceae archaeon]|jgi:hypothetical protein|nr:hypothetical protein [Methanobacteriaceae archaeon]
MIDLKFNGKYFNTQELLVKNYKKAFSSSKRHYTRFQLTSALNYDTRKPLTVLIHQKSPHNSKIFGNIK